MTGVQRLSARAALRDHFDRRPVILHVTRSIYTPSSSPFLDSEEIPVGRALLCHLKFSIAISARRMRTLDRGGAARRGPVRCENFVQNFFFTKPDQMTARRRNRDPIGRITESDSRRRGRSRWVLASRIGTVAAPIFAFCVCAGHLTRRNRVEDARSATSTRVDRFFFAKSAGVRSAADIRMPRTA
jgi:hypothetical protein